MDFKSNYGILYNINSEGFYDEEQKQLKECRCATKMVIDFPVGQLIPMYKIEEARSKNRHSMTFYPSGNIKSIYLQKQTNIATKLGEIPAEFITFYESGEILRIFPRYGQVSGFWSEEEETALLKPYKGEICGVKLNTKISCFCFYESGSQKSLTLAPGEKVTVKLSATPVSVRLGISFYESGEIETVEFSKPTLIETKIGPIVSFDNMPIGIHGDRNSCKLDKKGNVIGLKTLMTGVEIVSKVNGEKIEILPEFLPSQMNLEEFEMVPITINFENSRVIIIDSKRNINVFDLENFEIKTIFNPQYREDGAGCSSSCSTCSGCH